MQLLVEGRVQRCAALLAWGASPVSCLCVSGLSQAAVWFQEAGFGSRAGAPEQDVLWQLIRRPWGCPGSGVTAVFPGSEEMCLAPQLMEGSKVQPSPGSPLKKNL